MYPKTKNKIEELVNKGIMPGAAYCFIKGNQIYQRALGLRQIIPSKEQMTIDTLFDVASLTKVVGTNSVILKLLEEKRINIDDGLQLYLPEFQDKYVTIRHLLTHTSGINGFIPNRQQLSQEELIQAFLSLKSNPNLRGKEINYTDTGTVLLGLMIEQLYHKPVQRVIEEEVLQPLKMTQATFSPTGNKIAPTELDSRRGIIKGEVHDPKAFILKERCGSAGLFATLNDLMSFTFMMLYRGKMRDGEYFLKEETVTSLYQSWSNIESAPRTLGWDLRFEPETKKPILFHTGYTGTFMLIDSDQMEAFILLSNRVHPLDNKPLYQINRDELIDSYLEEKQAL
ncbi:serine hydrolase domain-containing protein [Vagococcus elongatus]|uniref:Beta-lactamase-related domain-containing protein n=1 Tax=Vagococcus elongatus TaxID=180344 RepID=A0A430AZX1_9ENTE|nr:serine hydrolase domain-containing protein [Vagococcus elongatus]RSU13551.1 hypothetical protein CBF29_04675 [Vagococcus elongatus]